MQSRANPSGESALAPIALSTTTTDKRSLNPNTSGLIRPSTLTQKVWAGKMARNTCPARIAGFFRSMTSSKRKPNNESAIDNSVYFNASDNRDPGFHLVSSGAMLPPALEQCTRSSPRRRINDGPSSRSLSSATGCITCLRGHPGRFASAGSTDCSMKSVPAAVRSARKTEAARLLVQKRTLFIEREPEHARRTIVVPGRAATMPVAQTNPSPLTVAPAAAPTHGTRETSDAPPSPIRSSEIESNPGLAFLLSSTQWLPDTATREPVEQLIPESNLDSHFEIIAANGLSDGGWSGTSISTSSDLVGDDNGTTQPRIPSLTVPPYSADSTRTSEIEHEAPYPNTAATPQDLVLQAIKTDLTASSRGRPRFVIRGSGGPGCQAICVDDAGSDKEDAQQGPDRPSKSSGVRLGLRGGGGPGHVSFGAPPSRGGYDGKATSPPPPTPRVESEDEDEDEDDEDEDEGDEDEYNEDEDHIKNDDDDDDDDPDSDHDLPDLLAARPARGRSPSRADGSRDASPSSRDRLPPRGRSPTEWYCLNAHSYTSHPAALPAPAPCSRCPSAR